MKLTLHVWRQRNADDRGGFTTYELEDVDHHMSFLEMLDVLNQDLIARGDDPVAFDHDCREGICGSCGFMINGVAHGDQTGSTVCQLHMRHFSDGDEITIEPWRAKAFPVVRDLVVDRSAFDRILTAGGFITVRTGSAPDAHTIPIDTGTAEHAMDFAECIGCGACVASCPNSAAMLFVGAKMAHLSLLPQGQPERDQRALSMVEAMEAEAFGSCTNYRSCEAVCPKEISIEGIARMNKDFRKALFRGVGMTSGKRR
ncbi:MAG: succinate dehydrogenase/fumarate reductase iron-sulfur subunit [Holophagae bacterium]|jgi:succinate dehydrogenase / fumarate reductase iron-sulfur subunit